MRRNSLKTRNRITNRKRGVAIVECTAVLSVLLLILLTLLDLGLAVLSYNALSAAARRAARVAIVRGEHAAPERPEWGPAKYETTADDTSEPAGIVRSMLATIPPKHVTVRIDWPDGDNRVNDRVRVTLNYRHVSIVPLPFASFHDLSAESTMRIVH